MPFILNVLIAASEPHSSFEKLKNSNIRYSYRSYIAYMEDYTISFTHGFTMKPLDRPEYVDMGGMAGDLIVPGTPFSRRDNGLCNREFWTSTSTLPDQSCPFIVGNLNFVSCKLAFLRRNVSAVFVWMYMHIYVIV